MNFFLEKMDSTTGATYLAHILNQNEILRERAPKSTDIPPVEAQKELLKNANTESTKSYFTKEELELLAVNPPLEPGHYNIEHTYVKDCNTDTYFDIHSNAKILYLHRLIQQKTGLAYHHQRLTFQSRQLDNYNSTFAELNLQNESIIKMNSGSLLSCASHAFSGPPTHLLDDRYHFDLTQLTDVDSTFYRGGTLYSRPCGWMRFALKCDQLYSDNIWLSGSTPRVNETSSAADEWIVSYHGTCHNNNGLTISSEGYKLTNGRKGIYSTPDKEEALKFSQSINVEGVTFKAIIQNRVNPHTVVRIPEQVTGTGEYWISPNENDIRSYGFCVRQM